MHPSSRTRNILKTHVLKSENNSDTVSVTAYGYHIEPRIDYINKMGGDGNIHTIPYIGTSTYPLPKPMCLI